jgi:hypothetical protein
MALDPAQRPRSAAELEHALLAFCRPTFREHVEAASAPFARATPFPTPGVYRPYGSTEPQPPPPQTVLQVPPTKRRVWPWALGALVVVGAGAGIAVSSMRTPPLPPPQPVATPVATPPPVVVAPPPPTVAPSVTPLPAATITLHFAVAPTSATITVDGKPVTSNELTVPHDEVTHHLQISAPGYVGHDEDLRFDESQRLAIELVHAPHDAPPTKQPHAHPAGKQPTIESESPYGN